MAHSHTYKSVAFITNNGSVMTDGFSANLAQGQFGIVNIDPALASSLGNKVTNVFPITKGKKFELAIGAPDLLTSAFRSNKSWRSVPFKLDEIIEISATAPKVGITLDKWILGYNGKAGSEIILKNGDNEVIDIVLEGKNIGMLGYAEGKAIVKMTLSAPNTGSFTMQEVVENAVKRFNKETLLGGVPVTDYIKVTPSNSNNEVTVSGANYTFYNLTVKDNGRLSDLALVQAQYPGQTIKRTSWDEAEGKTTYTILAPSGTSLANFVQTSVSMADANCDGIPETTSATVSTAWTTGTTCKAKVENYTIQLADNGCGNNRLADLQAAYPNLNITIDTPLQTQTVTLTGTSGTGNIVVNGVNYLVTFDTSLATTAANFVSTHSAALTALPGLGLTVTAAGAVLTFTANSSTFPIITFANVSGNLASTIGSIAGSGKTNEFLCQAVYRTRVFTNIVCEECSPEIRDLFVSESPTTFEYVDWDLQGKVYSDTAKMGIYFEGKEIQMYGTEEFKGEIPFVYSSTRVSVANEAPGYVNESYNAGTNGRFALKNLSVATDPVGLGKDMWHLEKYARQAFTGLPSHEGNNYAKWALGEESFLKPMKYYVQYHIKVRPVTLSQSMNGILTQNFDYMVIAEVGKHSGVESIVNALATAAGLPTVTAY